VPEGEGWARNSGVWIKIRTDNSKSHDDEKQETAKAKNSADTFPRWTQPQQANRMVKLWLSNAKDRVSGQDPLDVFLSNDKWIPDSGSSTSCRRLTSSTKEFSGCTK